MRLSDVLPKVENAVPIWPWVYEIQEIMYNSNVSWPKISIVTPSFNQGEYIEETIRSVLLQNYPNLEYIIIDGGSTDQTVDIIKKYEPWLNYWVSEPDSGQSQAINKGLKFCTGDIINWLNSDDWLEPNALFEIAAVFINNPSTSAVSGFEKHIGIDGEISLYEGTFLDHELCKTIERSQLAQPSTFFRSDVFKAVTPVPEDMHFIMDGELWVRYLLLYGHEGFKKLGTPLVNFRLHSNSKTVNNAIVDNFLIERSSIIIDLQRFVGVPSEVINFWITDVYRTPQLLTLNRAWSLNDKIISKRMLRIYFLKKFIKVQFLNGNKKRALWGIKQLTVNYALDFFLIKSILKLIVTK